MASALVGCRSFAIEFSSGACGCGGESRRPTCRPRRGRPFSSSAHVNGLGPSGKSFCCSWSRATAARKSSFARIFVAMAGDSIAAARVFANPIDRLYMSRNFAKWGSVRASSAVGAEEKGRNEVARSARTGARAMGLLRQVQHLLRVDARLDRVQSHQGRDLDPQPRRPARVRPWPAPAGRCLRLA